MAVSCVKSVNSLAQFKTLLYLCTEFETQAFINPQNKRDMEEYQATREEIINLINKFDDSTDNGKWSINEVAKIAYCESICNGVLELERNNKFDALQTIYAKFNGNIEQVYDAYSALTAPRILSGELDLAQCKEVFGYIQDEL